MRHTAYFIAIATVLTLGSCDSSKLMSRHNSTAGVMRLSQFKGEQGTVFWSFFDATKRSSVFTIDSTGKMHVLAEVPPDAAIAQISSLAFTASGKNKTGTGASADLKLETARSIAEMGKRTAAVNILRDALYRLAEMQNNLDPGVELSPAMQDLIKQVMQTAENISSRETSAEEATARANEEAAKAKQLEEVNKLIIQLKSDSQSVSVEAVNIWLGGTASQH